MSPALYKKSRVRLASIHWHLHRDTILQRVRWKKFVQKAE